ncbi:MAG TPA: GNAT family N-acetyltransferase [Ferruginibacter sp.]|nr:GNAT family N-acetyltransferase [Ferruginibacter sp.]
MHIFETRRLVLSRLTLGDAPFILELVNDPSWIRFIGDKNVHTLKAAKEYIKNGPQKSYAQLGFGLYAVKLKRSGKAIGMCGLLRRDTLDDADIGFAFLPKYTGKGYAFESAETVLKHAHESLKMKRILAITSIDNASSVKLLERLGFCLLKRVRLTPGSEELNLFEKTAA